MITFRSSGGSKKTGAKAGAGCLILFALPFAAFGVVALYSAVQKFPRGETRDAVMFLVMGVLFSIVGFGLMIAAGFGFKVQKRVEELKAGHPDEPWMWQEDWASGKIASANRTTMYFTWGFALFWNAITYSILFMFATEPGKKNMAGLVLLLYAVIGAGLVVWAVKTTKRWRRYGQSWFKVMNGTGVVGGQISGAIETSAKVYPKNGFHLKLHCVRVDSRGDGSSESIVWEDEKTIVKDILDDPRRSGVPVFFQIPGDCEPTAEIETNLKTLWRLEVSAKTDGTDYQARFEVPVFRTAESTAAGAEVVVDPTLVYQGEVKPYERPADSAIQIRALPDGRTEFIFPPLRNIGLIPLILIIVAVLGGMIGFFRVVGAGVIGMAITGTIGLLFGSGIVAVMLRSSRVTVGAQGIESNQDWKVYAKARRFEIGELTGVKAMVGMTSNDKVFYDLKAMLQWNRTATLATAIRSKKEAEWFAAEMNRLLKLDKPGTGGTMRS